MLRILSEGNRFAVRFIDEYQRSRIGSRPSPKTEAKRGKLIGLWNELEKAPPACGRAVR